MTAKTTLFVNVKLLRCQCRVHDIVGNVTLSLMTMMTTVPRLFAFVLGINGYKELRPKLPGAVADADAIIKYLYSKSSSSRIIVSRMYKDSPLFRHWIVNAQ